MKARLPQGYGESRGDMIKRVQKMQADMQAMQEELANREFTGTAGGGMVEVIMNGEKNVVSVKLNPDVVDKDDIEMLEDLITAAFNEAAKNVDTTSEEEMGKITGGMNIPGLM